MITAEELVLELNEDKESNSFKLATVMELFANNTAKLKFDGEDVVSEKEYAYLDSYVPKIDDRVLLGVLGGTYVILGKVNYQVSPSTEVEIDRYLFDLKKVIMQKGLNVTLGIETDTLKVNNAATLSAGATIVGNVGINGDVNAVKLSATGQVSGASVNAVGAVAGATLNISGAASMGNTDVNQLDVYGKLQHRGTTLGFFGSSAGFKQTVNNLSGTPTVENLRTKINDLLIALRTYNLIGGS